MMTNCLADKIKKTKLIPTINASSVPEQCIEYTGNIHIIFNILSLVVENGYKVLEKIKINNTLLFINNTVDAF